MKKLIGGLVVLAVVAGLGYVAVGPVRARVARKKLLNRVDELLGKTEVQRQQIKDRMREVEADLERLAHGKSKAASQAGRLGRQVREVEEKLADTDATLVKLKEHLQAGAPRELLGKTYTPDELKKMADRVLSLRKTLAGQRDSLRQAKGILDGAAATLQERYEAANGRLEALKDQLRKIDAKAVVLKALKDSPREGELDAGLADRLARLQADIDDLEDEIDATLAGHDRRWREATSKDEVEKVKKIVEGSNTRGPQRTIAEIDRVLGK